MGRARRKTFHRLPTVFLWLSVSYALLILLAYGDATESDATFAFDTSPVAHDNGAGDDKNALVLRLLEENLRILSRIQEPDICRRPSENCRRRHRRHSRRAFGRDNYLLPENFGSLRRKEIPVTYRLHDDLLRYYRKGTRPVTHPNKIVSVSMSVFLYQIIKLDAVKNTISLSGSFELYWQDEFLQWTPDAYEGATEIFLSSADIWIPEFSLYYSLNFNDAVKLVSNNDVRVNYTGHVRYYLPFSTESLCNSVDVKFFPFDIQQCTLLFGSWAHSNDSIKYSLYSKNLSLIDYYDNQEWQLDLSRSHIMSDGFLYDYLDPPLFWEMIVIDLVVARQSFYYVFNLVIPSAIITLVAVIGFHTPSTSGRVRDAKFRLGIMTLMSMSMILLAIVEDMPKFSISSNRKGRGSFSGIPLIGLYYFMLLAIVGLSTVTTSMFVFLERRMRMARRFPWYLRPFAVDLPTLPTPARLVERANSARSAASVRRAAGNTDASSVGPEEVEEAARRRRRLFNNVKSKSMFSMKMTPADDPSANQILLSSTGDGQSRHETVYLNGFVTGANSNANDSNNNYDGAGRRAALPPIQPRSSSYAQAVALSLLRLIPTESFNDDAPAADGGAGRRATTAGAIQYPYGWRRTTAEEGPTDALRHRQASDASTLRSSRDPSTVASMAYRRSEQRKQASSIVAHENVLIFEYLHQLLDALVGNMTRLERAVRGVRCEVANLSPSADLENFNSKWELAIRRLELLSLVFYVSLLFATMFLFFYHDWYCSIGHNPCGQPNLKCPWMRSDPSDASCR